ncbi:hypothetical protein VE02_06909 [Pseudogymnoascus sp. 03VT05]|nr:hypothetical protein VE02_06909 [Pseudogymnoascus sp. 03VT05]
MASTKFSDSFFLAARAEIESLDLHHEIVDELVGVLRLEQEHIGHQSFSDGEIYLKIVEAKIFGLEKYIQIWQARLSSRKQTSLKSLLGRKKISDAFNELRVFSGLWKGLELGNISDLLALHLKEIIHYLRHIKSVWDKITQGKDALKRAVCPKTVQFLQLRAPAASTADRKSIIHAIRYGTIFQGVLENDKRAITRTLLNLTVIIPTIKTLHKNQKLIEIGVKILKDTILFDKGPRTTIRQALREEWTPPRDMRIETKEGQFLSLHNLTPSAQWELTYQQIWLFILRDFPGLSGTAPRLDSRKKPLQSCCIRDSATKRRFSRFTAHLGIVKSKKNTEISAKCTHCTSVHHAVTNSSADGEIRDRRCGRPFYSSYMQYKSELYLPTLAKTLTRSYNELPTSTYVLRDFMLSFFGPTSISVRTNEKPLKHSIFISDEDTLSESITSPRVSSDDDDVVEESASL